MCPPWLRLLDSEKVKSSENSFLQALISLVSSHLVGPNLYFREPSYVCVCMCVCESVFFWCVCDHKFTVQKWLLFPGGDGGQAAGLRDPGQHLYSQVLPCPEPDHEHAYVNTDYSNKK